MDVYIAEGSLQLYFTNPTYTSMIFFSGRKEERHLGPRPWARRKDSDSHHNSPEDRKSEIIQSRLKRTDRTLPSSSSICRIYGIYMQGIHNIHSIRPISPKGPKVRWTINREEAPGRPRAYRA